MHRGPRRTLLTPVVTAGGSAAFATFVSAKVANTVNSAVNISSGPAIQAGDLVLVHFNMGFSGGETLVFASDSASLTGLAVDKSYGPNNESLFYGIMTSGQASNGQVTFGGADTGGTTTIAVYRPPTGRSFAAPAIYTASQLPDAIENATSLTLTGPGSTNANHAGMVGSVICRALTNGSEAITGFTAEVRQNGTNFGGAVFDKLASGYSGGNVTVTGLTAGGAGFYTYGHFIEMILT